MTRHFSTFVLAAILTVAATTLTISSAFCADYERRVEFEKSEVCSKDSPWNLIVEKVIPEEGQAFGDTNFVNEAEMPRTSVGRFFGGAWGTDGFKPFMFGSGRWRLWEVNKAVPGWRVDLNDQGLFLHAQKGEQGTAFVFVGAIPAGSSQREAVLTANSLDQWLTVNGEFWSQFEEAVAATGTGTLAKANEGRIDKVEKDQAWDRKRTSILIDTFFLDNGQLKPAVAKITTEGDEIPDVTPKTSTQPAETAEESATADKPATGEPTEDGKEAEGEQAEGEQAEGGEEAASDSSKKPLGFVFWLGVALALLGAVVLVVTSQVKEPEKKNKLKTAGEALMIAGAIAMVGGMIIASMPPPGA